MQMWDSTTAADIPRSADAPGNVVVAWNGGEFNWSDADRASFSHAVLQSISPNASIAADWLDIERGDVDPTDVADITGWVAREHGGLYLSYSNWAMVRGYFPKDPPPWWVADYLGTLPPTPPVIPAAWLALGVVAWQYAGSPGTSPGHYDMSVTAPGWPVLPAPSPEEAEHMNGPVFAPDGSKVYAGIYAANGHVIELAETGPGSNAYLWRDVHDLVTNATPTPPPGIE
jgi:hypothetical protein